MLLVVYGTPALDTVIVNAPPEMGPAAVVVIVHTARLREAKHVSQVHEGDKSCE